MVPTSFSTLFQAVHEGKDCKQYQQELLLDSMDESSRATKLWMDVSILNYYGILKLLAS